MKRFKMKKLAAIDIGSNAVRLLIANTYIENNNPTYKKISLIFEKSENFKIVMKKLHLFRIVGICYRDLPGQLS